MSDEIWKPIPGFRGHYSASSLGRIKSEARIIHKVTGIVNLKEKIRKLVLGVDGYYRIVLRKDNKSYGFLVHRLILSAFEGQVPKGFEGCHFDGDSQNNTINNLCWAPHSENEKHKIRNNTTNRGSNHYLTKLNEVKVKKAKLLLSKGYSQQKVADRFEVDRRVINQIATGKTWKHVEI